MERTAMPCQETYTFRIACDERCSLVTRLAAVVKWWDKQHKFIFIDRSSTDAEDQKLLTQLDLSPWSLLLFDDLNDRWDGPDSIPIILKNLPGGKIAAVLYILPGTMWLTRQLYSLVSRNRRRLVQRHITP